MNTGSKYKLGGFLVIPLKYKTEKFSMEKLQKNFRRVRLETMDINENIKDMFNSDGGSAIGSVYHIPRSFLLQHLEGENCLLHPDTLQVVDAQGNYYDFIPEDSVLYVFRTGVAFLCVRLIFNHIQALDAICCPGFAQSTSRYSWKDSGGAEHAFQMDSYLETVCGSLQFERFFPGNSRFLLEAYTYTLAVYPEYFPEMEEMKRITFNLHQMIPVETETRDYSEEDVRFVFAVKNGPRNAYRWGCCITSQTCAYVTANPELDLESELNAQEEDGLPLVVLALYEKYTCLLFTQLLAESSCEKRKSLQALKNRMLEFRSYGTVTPANLSRWHNVKQIYATVLDQNGVAEAVEDISTKLTIVAEHQQELVRSRNENMINIITVFGIVSIVASVLSIVQILSDGNPVFWLSTILTSVTMTIALWLAMHFRK